LAISCARYPAGNASGNKEIALKPRLLLDTHVLVRWGVDVKKLSRSQRRALDEAAERGEPVALSAMSLLEIALLASGTRRVFRVSLEDFLRDLDSNPAILLLPLTSEVALEAAAIGNGWDPADRAIVATARVHRLKLVTSDQRIIESRLVATIE